MERIFKYAILDKNICCKFCTKSHLQVGGQRDGLLLSTWLLRRVFIPSQILYMIKLMEIRLFDMALAKNINLGVKNKKNVFEVFEHANM